MLHTVDPLIISFSPFRKNWFKLFFLIVSSENVYNPRCYIYLCFTFDQSQGKLNLFSLRCYFNLYSAPPQEFYDITLENRSPLHNFIILILHLYLLVFCNNSPCTYTVDPSLPRNLMKTSLFKDFQWWQKDFSSLAQTVIFLKTIALLSPCTQ